MHKRFLMILLAASLSLAGSAKVRLPHLIGDNMVLQAGTDARLWGWGQPGSTVKLSVSWNEPGVSAKVGKDGRWMAKVRTPKAGFKPLSITFDDGEKTTINNVLAGEVWVCAGQSNMEMPIRGFEQCPVEGYNEVVAQTVQYPYVRHVKVPSVRSMKPLDDAQCHWEDCDAAHVANASATGYFFGRLVSRLLNVPVGLIEANKGGSRVESWLSRDNLAAHTDEPLDSVSISKRPADYTWQLVWGNGTFNPVLNCTVRGIIYYQGCSNVGQSKHYAERLKLLAEQWRKGFGLGQIPFYFVEIAPFFYGNDSGTAAALLREQQYKASAMIPNSGFVGTNDCVYPFERRNIHPSQKLKVGERLAFLALSDTYGVKGFMYKNPSFESMKVDGDKAYIKLKDTYGGVQPIDGIEGFEVAGEDKVFHPATARADMQKGIIVSSPEVGKPAAVRYCFRNFKLGNLKNQGGLPLIPFRTDNWDE